MLGDTQRGLNIGLVEPRGSLRMSCGAVQHAPVMIKTLLENRVSTLLRMIGSEGAFAEAIFMGFNTVARSELAKASELKMKEKLQRGMKLKRDEVVQEEDEDRHRDKRIRVEGEGVEGDESDPSESGPGESNFAESDSGESDPDESDPGESGSAEDGPES